MSKICSAVLIPYRRVTDRQTDRQTDRRRTTANTTLTQRRAGKILCTHHLKSVRHYVAKYGQNLPQEFQPTITLICFMWNLTKLNKVSLTGRNRIGPPPTRRRPAGPPAGSVRDPDRRRQTTEASVQNNTVALGGPVITLTGIRDYTAAALC